MSFFCTHAAALAAALWILHGPVLAAAELAADEAEVQVAALLELSSLDRASVVAAVLAANPELEALDAAAASARARIRQVSALPDPRLSYQFAPASIDSDEVDYGQVISVQQRIPWAGKRGAAGRAAAAEAEATDAQVAVARLRLAEQASQLLDDLWLVAASRSSVEAHQALVQDLLAIAKRQVETGRGTLTDPIQAEEQLARLAHRLVVLEQRHDAQVAALNGLLHRSPLAALPPIPPPDPQSLAPREAPSAETAVAAALAARPELAALAAQQRAVQARLRMAQLDGSPDVGLHASYNSMWMQEEHQFMVGVSIDLPIQRGRIRGGIEEQRAALRRLTAEEASLRDRVAVVVEQARLRYQESRHVVRLYRDRHLPLAQERLEIIRAAYVTGGEPFDFVVDAERNLLDVQLGHLEAMAEAGRRWAALQSAMGDIAMSDPFLPASAEEQP